MWNNINSNNLICILDVKNPEANFVFIAMLGRDTNSGFTQSQNKIKNLLPSVCGENKHSADSLSQLTGNLKHSLTFSGFHTLTLFWETHTSFSAQARVEQQPVEVALTILCVCVSCQSTTSPTYQPQRSPGIPGSIHLMKENLTHKITKIISQD